MTSTLTEVPSYEQLRTMFQTLFGKLPEPQLARETTALLVVDMQYGGCHPDYGHGAKAKELGLFPAMRYYWDRIGDTVVPNVQRLLDTCRRKGIEVIHFKIAHQTKDGRDGLHRMRALGGHRPNPKETEILSQVAPQGDEIVLSKTTCGAFYSTNIDQVLRSLGIRDVIVAGVVTNVCVDATVQGASEHDYGVVVVEDATVAHAPQLHQHSIFTMSYRDATIKTTQEVVQLLDAL